MEEKIVLTTFTDPMMGLSWECEPVFRRLETHYDGRIEFRTVMGGLVRDVEDFMTPSERALPPELGLPAYCKRLAGIYKSEEPIGGLPIRMEGFRLFDPAHRSSYPLCVAYEAAKLAAPEQAEQFLYRLRHATVVETQQTTLEEEQLRAAELAGLDTETFLRALRDGSAEKAFRADLELTRSLGIYSLPMTVAQYGGRAVLCQPLHGAAAVESAIQTLTGGNGAACRSRLVEAVPA